MLALSDIPFSVFAALICVGLITAISASRQLAPRLTRLLAAYLASGAVWCLALAWAPHDRVLAAQSVSVAGTAVTGVLLALLAGFGQERARHRWRWIAIGGCLAVLLPVLTFCSTQLGWGARPLLDTWMFQMLASVVWGVFALDGVIAIARSVSLRWTRAVVGWSLAFAATGAGLASVLCSWPHIERLAPLWYAVGAMATTFGVFTVNRVEARSTFRHLLAYLGVTMLLGLVLLGIFMIVPALFAGSTLVPGILIASGVLGIVYQALHRMVRRAIDHFLFGRAVDYADHLRAYNRNVRNVLDPDQLAEVMMFTVRDSLGVDRGVLLVGDTSDDEIGDITFEAVGDVGLENAKSPRFRAFSPFMDDLRRKGVAVTQRMLDADPRFQAVREHERVWLKSLGVQLFVPVRSRGQLVGILALGPKRNRWVYRADEIEFLVSLGDQSGFALENARLFANMRTLNAVLNRLYTDLDEVTRRLQEMDKLKSAFIGVITHELRSPLVGIDFSLQLLKRQSWDRLDPEQQEPIDDIVRGFDQLKTMIDKLVAFASFLSKQGELRKEEVDFGAVVREAVAPLEVMAQFRQIVLHIQIPDRLPAVWADRERLSEAVYHLVHNAIRFNLPQGQIVISCETDRDMINFQVVDSGIGIEAEKLDTIWDGFSQSADPLRRGVEGLGLGLALVKYIVSAHAGEVWAASYPNQGSTFGFRIPLGQPVVQAGDEMSPLIPSQTLLGGQ